MGQADGQGRSRSGAPFAKHNLSSCRSLRETHSAGWRWRGAVGGRAPKRQQDDGALHNDDNVLRSLRMMKRPKKNVTLTS